MPKLPSTIAELYIVRAINGIMSERKTKDQLKAAYLTRAARVRNSQLSQISVVTSEESELDTSTTMAESIATTHDIDERITEQIDNRLEAIFKRFEATLDSKLNQLSESIESKVLRQIDEKITNTNARVATLEQKSEQTAKDLKKLGAKVKSITEKSKETPANVAPSNSVANDEVITQLQERIKQLEAKCEEHSQLMAQSNKELTSQLEKVELHGRKLNLVFTGVAYTKQEDCKRVITEIIRNDMQLDMTDPIDVAHRKYKQANMDKSVPIVVRFKTVEEKFQVLSKGHRLKTLAIYVQQDYPTSYNDRRSELFKQLRHAKEADPNARVFRDKLRFKGKLYSVETVHTADFARPECTVYTDNEVRFYGKYSPFSNFYECGFEMRGLNFTCVEQAIMFFRARRHHNYDAAARIKGAAHPAEMKKIGNPMKPRSVREKEEEKQVILEAVTRKFDSNPELNNTLKETGQRKIIECNPYDSYYGAGVALTDSSDDLEYNGDNVMGNILEEVRSKCV